MLKITLIFLLLLQTNYVCAAKKGKLLYASSFSNAESVKDWTMEGPGKLEFKDGSMTMYSPGEKMHHVFWCPEVFPNSFVAEWEVQNLNTEAGLAIVFFAATGLNGEDIFNASLSPRDGTFKQYVEGDIRSYHISYYANAAHNKNRGHANLRKNNTFTLLQKGKEGIPTLSTKNHKIRLLKHQRKIVMWIDEREIINFTDTAKQYWKSGKIGFRQMQWSRIQYRNLNVWAYN